MSVQVRLCDLASAKCVELSARMSAAVLISMNQSSNFEESCPSNVGISWSMVMVRLDPSMLHTGCLCMPALSLYWFLTGLGGWLECHGEML